MVFPEHANHYGTLFGGNALHLMAKAAFLAAGRPSPIAEAVHDEFNEPKVPA